MVRVAVSALPQYAAIALVRLMGRQPSSHTTDGCVRNPRWTLPETMPPHSFSHILRLESLMNWLDWIAVNWTASQQGRKLVAPPWLPHATTAGFQPVRIATPEGQCADWKRSYTDGSRVHVHEFFNGSRTVHRDQYDPDASVGHMLAHLLIETAVGPVLAVILLAVAAHRSLGQ